MRAIVVQAGDETAINRGLGYPRPCYNAATGEVVPGVFATGFRGVEKDDRGRDVLVVDDVEAALPAPLQARVVTVARPVVEAVAAPEEPVVSDPRSGP